MSLKLKVTVPNQPTESEKTTTSDQFTVKVACPAVTNSNPNLPVSITVDIKADEVEYNELSSTI